MAASVNNRSINEAAIAEVPAFHFFSLMGKVGPFKVALSQVCKRARRAGALGNLKDEQSPRDADMDALIKVLQDAALAAENMDLHVWSVSTGH